MADLFLDSVAEIRAAYARLGHRRGWRFLVTPRRTLASDAKVAFLTQNPGGKESDPTHGEASCEAGSAYIHEQWVGFPPGAAPLQRHQRVFVVQFPFERQEIRLVANVHSMADEL